MISIFNHTWNIYQDRPYYGACNNSQQISKSSSHSRYAMFPDHSEIELEIHNRTISEKSSNV